MEYYEFREFYDANIKVKKINGNTLELVLLMPAIQGNEAFVGKTLEQKYREFRVQVENGSATIKGSLSALKGTVC